MAGKYPPHDEVAAVHEDSAWLVAALHNPERMIIAELAAYPAHLHIDLLPPYQGGGHGRALIDTFLAAAAREGAAAVHLGVNPENTRALGFYEHLGFRPIEITSREVFAVYLGRPTDLRPVPGVTPTAAEPRSRPWGWRRRSSGARRRS